MSEQRLMEDRRTAIAIFLCIAIVMVYTQVVFPPQRMAQPPAPTQPAEPSVAGADAASGVAPHTLNTCLLYTSDAADDP